MISAGNHAHYEVGIEGVLRRSNITYISTYERRMALLKSGKKLKNFDALIMSKQTLIIDFKGKLFSYPGAKSNKWENWLYKYHVKDLITWNKVFSKSNCNVLPLLVYVYKLTSEEDIKSFEDVYFHDGFHYGVVAIPPSLYLKNSKPRAKNIINVSRSKFKELVKPLSFYVPEIKYN